jgi:hypothetical protein
MTDTGLILGEPSSYLLFTIFFSLLTSHFYCPFLSLCSSHRRILSKSITIIHWRKPKTMNHVQQSSTQESPSIVILGAREWKMELLVIWQRVFYLVCALLGMGVEGAGGGIYRRAVCKVVLGGVWSGGDGAGAMRQQVRQRGRGTVLLAIMAVGALQRGRGRR